MRLKQQNKTTGDALAELIEFLAEAKERFSEIDTALCELRRLRGAIRQQSAPLTTEQVLEAIARRTEPALAGLFSECTAQTIRLGKVRVYAPDGLTYATLNLSRDRIERALEDEFGTAFEFIVLHRIK
jgi:hypothetical protein